jgi:hypothetical protein
MHRRLKSTLPGVAEAGVCRLVLGNDGRVCRKSARHSAHGDMLANQAAVGMLRPWRVTGWRTSGAHVDWLQVQFTRGMYAIELVLVVASTSSLALTLAASVGGTYGAYICARLTMAFCGSLSPIMDRETHRMLLRSLLCMLREVTIADVRILGAYQHALYTFMLTQRPDDKQSCTL